MIKKRGRVILVSFVLFLYLMLSIAEEESLENKPNINRYGVFDLGTWEGEDYCEGDPGDTSDQNRDAIAQSEIVPSDRVGCRAAGCEEDSPDDDDCASVYSYQGTIVYGLNVENIFESNIDGPEHDPDDCDSEADAAANIYRANYRSWDGNAYICASEFYWYGCTPELLGTLTWVTKENKDVVYNCTWNDVKSKEYVIWEDLPGYDADHDGHTTSDCDDNPSDDPSICADLTVDQCSLSTSQCALCINPDAVETCGDTTDNDCNSETSDNCNQFKEGCEQSSLKKDNQPDEIPGAEQRNNHGESYSWISTDEGGYCCGYNGITDLGEIVDSSQNEGQFLCLNNDKELVGVAGGDITTIGDSWKSRCDGKDWCFVSAGGNAQFHIYTIHKPGNNPYDVVSNSVAWNDCTTEGPADVSSLVGQPTEQMKANRFYCYQEGNRWSFLNLEN